MPKSVVQLIDNKEQYTEYIWKHSARCDAGLGADLEAEVADQGEGIIHEDNF